MLDLWGNLRQFLRFDTMCLAPGPKNSGDFAHPVAGRNSPQTTCGHGLQKFCSANANERMSGELIKLINSKQPNGLFS